MELDVVLAFVDLGAPMCFSQSINCFTKPLAPKDIRILHEALCSILGFLVLHDHPTSEEEQQNLELEFATWAVPLVNHRRAFDISILKNLIRNVVVKEQSRELASFRKVFYNSYTCCAGSYREVEETSGDHDKSPAPVLSRIGPGTMVPGIGLQAMTLSVETVKSGILFLMEPGEEADNITVDSVLNGLKTYIGKLQQCIVSLNTIEALKKFIVDRQWIVCWGGSDKDAFLFKVDQVEDDSQRERYLHQFILENLARTTKVVVWFVDGMHRVSVAESISNGVSPIFPQENHVLTESVKTFGSQVKYCGPSLCYVGDNGASVDQESILKIWFPGKEFDGGFVQRMSDLSLEEQAQIGQANPHNILHHTTAVLNSFQFPTLEEGLDKIDQIDLGLDLDLGKEITVQQMRDFGNESGILAQTVEAFLTEVWGDETEHLDSPQVLGFLSTFTKLTGEKDQYLKSVNAPLTSRWFYLIAMETFTSFWIECFANRLHQEWNKNYLYIDQPSKNTVLGLFLFNDESGEDVPQDQFQLVPLGDFKKFRIHEHFIQNMFCHTHPFRKDEDLVDIYQRQLSSSQSFPTKVVLQIWILMWANTSSIANDAIRDLLLSGPINTTFPQEDEATDLHFIEYLLLFVESCGFHLQNSRNCYRYAHWTADRVGKKGAFCRMLGKSHPLLEAILLPQVMRDISDIFRKIGTAPKVDLYNLDDYNIMTELLNIFQLGDDVTAAHATSDQDAGADAGSAVATTHVTAEVEDYSYPPPDQDQGLPTSPSPPSSPTGTQGSVVKKLQLFQQYAKQMDWTVAIEIAQNPLFALTAFLEFMCEACQFKQTKRMICDQALMDTFTLLSQKYQLDDGISHVWSNRQFFGKLSHGGTNTLNMNLSRKHYLHDEDWNKVKKPLITPYRISKVGWDEFMDHQLSQYQPKLKARDGKAHLKKMRSNHDMNIRGNDSNQYPKTWLVIVPGPNKGLEIKAEVPSVSQGDNSGSGTAGDGNNEQSAAKQSKKKKTNSNANGKGSNDSNEDVSNNNDDDDDDDDDDDENETGSNNATNKTGSNEEKPRQLPSEKVKEYQNIFATKALDQAMTVAVDLTEEETIDLTAETTVETVAYRIKDSLEKDEELQKILMEMSMEMAKAALETAKKAAGGKRKVVETVEEKGDVTKTT